MEGEVRGRGDGRGMREVGSVVVLEIDEIVNIRGDDGDIVNVVIIRVGREEDRGVVVYEEGIIVRV